MSITDTELLDWADKHISDVVVFPKNSFSVGYIPDTNIDEWYSTPFKKTLRGSLQAAYNGETDE